MTDAISAASENDTPCIGCNVSGIGKKRCLISTRQNCLARLATDSSSSSAVSVSYFSLLTLLFTIVLSQWDFSHGKFGLPSPGKTSHDRVALPNLRRTLGVLVFP